MSHREKIKKLILRLSYLALVVGFYVGFFFVLDSDFWAATFLIVCLFWLVMFVVSFKAKKESPEVAEMIKKSIFANPMSLDDIKKTYRYYNLDDENYSVLRLFFNKSGDKRCVVYQESNAVRISFETLEYRSDMSKMWMLDFAHWLPEGEETGLYADADLAIKDNKKALDGYEEDKTQIEKRRKFNVEILWKNIDITSDLIPFGSYNEFDIQVKEKLIKNVIIHNHHWQSKNESLSHLFIKFNDAFEKNKRFKFKILKDGNVIGFGYCAKDSSFNFWD